VGTISHIQVCAIVQWLPFMERGWLVCNYVRISHSVRCRWVRVCVYVCGRERKRERERERERERVIL
jgi:hypothetical protein